MPGVARGLTRAGLLLLLLLVCGPAPAVLPGVHEFSAAPEAITDAELSTLFGEAARKADVVALGETVHGSAGLLRVQTRLIRHLVEHQGLRLIVWENPVLRSLELAQWLAGCASGQTSAQAEPPLAVLYFPVMADRPLWAWLCRYNAQHPHDPVVFRGMDVWDRPWEHFARIGSLGAAAGMPVALIERIRMRCPGSGAASWEDLDRLLPPSRTGPRFGTDSGYDDCRAALTQLLETARRAAGRRTGDAAAAHELALSASTLLGWLGFHHLELADDVLSWNERDRAQGRNLMLLMEMHGVRRALLAAHSSHVSHNRSAADWWGFGDIKSGVFFFQELTGRRVFNVALTAYQAGGAQGEWLLPDAANSLDRRLFEAGHRFARFTADAPFLAAHSRWWMQNGNAAGMENGILIVPRDHFDAYVFVDRSPLEGLLPARPVWRP